LRAPVLGCVSFPSCLSTSLSILSYLGWPTHIQGGSNFGEPPTRAVDLLIGATALACELPLYTRNEQDFRALYDLLDIRVM